MSRNFFVHGVLVLQAAKAQYMSANGKAGWFFLKRKRVVFASVSRTRRGKARLHHGQRKVLRRLKVMWQITAKESHICK